MNKKIKEIMFLKELKVEFRNKAYLASVIICNIILFLCIAYYYNTIFSKTSTGYSSDYKLVLGMYNTLLLIEYIIVLCTIPFTCGSSLAKEYELKTLDLLLLSNISTSDIINIKIKKTLVTYGVLVVSTLPLLSIVFSVGVVNVFNLLLYVIVVMSSVICYTCIGMFVATKIRKKTLTALILAVVEIVTTLGTYVLCGLVYNIIDGINEKTAKLYTSTNLLFLGNILVANPVFSVFKLQSDIEGNTSIYRTLMNNYGVLGFVDKLWIPISVTIQLAVAWYFIILAKRKMKKRHYK